MKTYIALLLFLAGVAVSYILVKDSSLKCRRASKICSVSSRIEELIRYTRSPMSEIFSSFGESEEDFVSNADEVSRELYRSICSSDYDAALSNAVLLKNHTEKEMKRITESESRLRKAKIVLPPCAAVLTVILLL